MVKYERRNEVFQCVLSISLFPPSLPLSLSMPPYMHGGSNAFEAGSVQLHHIHDLTHRRGLRGGTEGRQGGREGRKEQKIRGVFSSSFWIGSINPSINPSIKINQSIHQSINPSSSDSSRSFLPPSHRTCLPSSR